MLILFFGSTPLDEYIGFCWDRSVVRREAVMQIEERVSMVNAKMFADKVHRLGTCALKHKLDGAYAYSALGIILKQTASEEQIAQRLTALKFLANWDTCVSRGLHSQTDFPSTTSIVKHLEN